MYSAAPKDGTAFGMPVPALVSSAFSNPDGTRYEAAKFTMIGRMVDLPRVFVARADSGIKSLQDAAKSEREIPHGIMTMTTTFTRGPSNFGKGDVRGVIAAESSNNATVGGSLLPTVAGPGHADQEARPVGAGGLLELLFNRVLQLAWPPALWPLW